MQSNESARTSFDAFRETYLAVYFSLTVHGAVQRGELRARSWLVDVVAGAVGK